MCKFAVRALYGVGSGTVNKIYKREEAFHFGKGRKEPRHPELKISLRENSRTRWTGVLMYFWVMYHNVAEVLPAKYEMPAFAEFSSSGHEVVEVDQDEVSRHLNGFLQKLDSSLYNPDSANVGPGTLKGPRRYVQCAKPSVLYYDYCAWESANGRQPGCFNTFLNVYKKVFKTHLAFRNVGLHSQCTVCTKLKTESAKARSQERKSELQRIYASHLLSQWLDRQYYWGLRSLSASTFRSWLDFGQKFLATTLANSVMTMAIDGMDQSKFRVPRTLRPPSKIMARLYRPAVHCVAAWIHGLLLNVYISNPDTKKDSSTQAEVVALCLGEALERCSNQLPLGLHIQIDNTYREGKNTFFMAFLLTLLLRRSFRWISVGFLRSGHSCLHFLFIFLFWGLS